MYTLVCTILLIVAIIFGNVLTITAGRSSYNHFSVTCNQLILSLAVSDLCVGFAMLYYLVYIFAPSIGGYKYLCLLRFVFFCGASMASFFNILAIAINRYVAIAYPLKYSKYITKKRSNAVIIFNWCTALIISTTPFYWNNYHSTLRCAFINFIPSYYLDTILIPIFFIVWLSIFILYWRIWRASRARDYKCNQVVLLILGSFTLCWMPFVITTAIQCLDLPYHPSQILRRMVFFIAMLNSGINPMIYAWNNPNFRQAFHNLMKRKPLVQHNYDSNFQTWREQPDKINTVSAKVNQDDEKHSSV